MLTFALLALAIGSGLVVYALRARRREDRRLLPGVVVLIGVLVIVLSGAGTLSVSGVFPEAFLRLLQALFTLTLLGYPVITVFLLVNAVLMGLRERRSLANRLPLLLGAGMLMLPIVMIATVVWAPTIGPAATVMLWIGLVVVGVLAYGAFCFAAFLLSSLAYRRTPRRFVPSYVIVLGAGLSGRRVTPLLARRLDRAIAEFRRHGGTPVLIPSGGRGTDEPIAEGVAMADYLREQGVPSDRIRIEDRAVNTRENLMLSRALMGDPDAPITVATSDYHVLRTAMATKALGMNARVCGARTARYYSPSAFMREFAAIMLVHRLLNAVLMGAYLALMLCLYVVTVR